MKENRIRKWLACILAAVMLLSCGAAAWAEDAEDFFFDDEEDSGDLNPTGWVYTGPEYDYDRLVVGHTTALSGNFTTQMWGYNTSDVDVTALVNGYNLSRWDYGLGSFHEDETVVSGVAVLERDGTEISGSLLVHDDTEGNRTFVFGLNEELEYSDGTPILAKDYAFNVLLETSPQALELGADTDNYAGILGVEAYRSGESAAISGVRILGDHMLSLTVSRAYLPYFYEMGLLRCWPKPLHVIAPGCDVKDDGEGAYIEGPFTAELLKKTLLDPETGYVSHPSVVSGPYRLTAYDAETHVAEFEINDKYRGNWEGLKPVIRYLTLKPAANETMMEQLEAGEFGLINKTLNAESIQKGIVLAGSQNYAMSSYARIGQSYISFNCEKPVVSSQAVRQAIACCLDKDETVSRYAGVFGTRVDGYYGIGQWMYRVVSGAMEPPIPEPDENASAAELDAYEKALEAWDELSLDGVPVYNLDTEKAAALLAEDGWTLNREGRPFTPGTDDVRCRKTEDGLETLELSLVYPEGNAMGEILSETFLPHLREAGILVKAEPMNWQKLLRQYYRQEERDCDMMYLASNFFEVFDPWPTFDPRDADIGKTNYTGIRDQELCDLAKDMTLTEPGNTFEYETKWLAFQKRYAEVLPAIPVYGNAYFDFYTRCLQGYTVNDDVTWTDAILAAYMSDPALLTEEADAEEEEGEEGGFGF